MEINFHCGRFSLSLWGMPDPAKVWQRVNMEEQAIQTGSKRTIVTSVARSRDRCLCFLPVEASTWRTSWVAPIKDSSSSTLNKFRAWWHLLLSPPPLPPFLLLLLLILNHILGKITLWTQHAKICTSTEKLLQKWILSSLVHCLFLAKHEPEDINIHSHLCQVECLTLNVFNFSHC